MEPFHRNPNPAQKKSSFFIADILSKPEKKDSQIDNSDSNRSEKDDQKRHLVHKEKPESDSVPNAEKSENNEKEKTEKLSDRLWKPSYDDKLQKCTHFQKDNICGTKPLIPVQKPLFRNLIKSFSSAANNFGVITPFLLPFCGAARLPAPFPSGMMCCDTSQVPYGFGHSFPRHQDSVLFQSRASAQLHDTSISVPVPLPVYVRTRSPDHGDGSMKPKKCRRSRTVFSELQLMGLEKKFETQKYLSTPDRIDIAESLGLSQIQVKTWYQNRRMKWKKQVLQGGGQEPPTKPKGRPKKNCNLNEINQSEGMNESTDDIMEDDIILDDVTDEEPMDAELDEMEKQENRNSLSPEQRICV